MERQKNNASSYLVSRLHRGHDGLEQRLLAPGRADDLRQREIHWAAYLEKCRFDGEVNFQPACLKYITESRPFFSSAITIRRGCPARALLFLLFENSKAIADFDTKTVSKIDQKWRILTRRRSVKSISSNTRCGGGLLHATTPLTAQRQLATRSAL